MGPKNYTNPFSFKFKNKSIFVNESLDNRYYLDVKILGKPVKGLLDSGAVCTVLGEGYKDIIQDAKLLDVGPSFVNTAGGEPHKVLGCVCLPCTVQNETQLVYFLVVPSIKSQLILGVDFWRRFNIRPQVFFKFDSV